MINGYKIQKDLINKRYKKNKTQEDIINKEYVQDRYIFVGTPYFTVRIPKKEYFLKCLNQKMTEYDIEYMEKFLDTKYNEDTEVKYLGMLINSLWKEKVALFQDKNNKNYVVKHSILPKGINFRNMNKACVVGHLIFVYDFEYKVCCVIAPISDECYCE